MLRIRVEPVECFDDNNHFYWVPEKPVELQLEHSLVSISKWEAKWHKSFLSTKDKTNEELLDYIRCMTINTVDPLVYGVIGQKELKKIIAYIEDSMTATTFDSTNEEKTSQKIITSEVIYYLMIAYNIPFECQKWHLNRLMTLIRVCAVKNAPERKMSTKEIISRNRALNKARRARLNSKG